MSDIIDIDEQIRNPSRGSQHLVMLGAGASRAACPNGDRNGKKLPVMSEIGEVINIDGISSFCLGWQRKIPNLKIQI